uniref:Polyprotein protein n=2 Tax=Oryza sativa subsp. japonica TaxID=39947 RepID=Q8W2Y1_ORYSJ|nr:putative polyprotein precursor protein [Oryza sativa Japonica Group]
MSGSTVPPANPLRRATTAPPRCRPTIKVEFRPSARFNSIHVVGLEVERGREKNGSPPPCAPALARPAWPSCGGKPPPQKGKHLEGRSPSRTSATSLRRRRAPCRAAAASTASTAAFSRRDASAPQGAVTGQIQLGMARSSEGSTPRRTVLCRRRHPCRAAAPSSHLAAPHRCHLVAGPPALWLDPARGWPDPAKAAPDPPPPRRDGSPPPLPRRHRSLPLPRLREGAATENSPAAAIIARPPTFRRTSITISETPPEHWQKGVKHLVLFHIKEIHDYTAAAVDLRNTKSCRPATRTLPPWHLGVLDGERLCRASLKISLTIRRRRGPTPSATATRKAWRTMTLLSNGRPATKEAEQSGMPLIVMVNDAMARNAATGAATAAMIVAAKTGAEAVTGDTTTITRTMISAVAGDATTTTTTIATTGDATSHVGEVASAAWTLTSGANARAHRAPMTVATWGGATDGFIWLAAVIRKTAVAAASVEGALRQMLVAAGVAVALDKLAAPVALDKPAANAAAPSPPVIALASLAMISSTTRELLPITSAEKTLPSLNAECAAAPTLQDTLAANDLSPVKDTETAPTPDIADFDSVQVTPPRVLFKELPSAILSTPQVLIDIAGDTQVLIPPDDALEVVPIPVAADMLGEGRRRSPRLARQPVAGLLMSLRAQLNLCRRLGTVPAEGVLTDKALADFKAMFNSPLPQDAIDALTQLFGFDKEDAKTVDPALANYLGLSDIGCQEEIAAA